MDPIEQCQSTVDTASALIAGVRAEDLAKPTPCSEWDVRGLISHMIVVANNFTRALAGQKMDDPGSAAPELVGADAGADYRIASGAMMNAWREPGALERTLAMPIGDAPGAMGIRIATYDTLIHSWDLARALGRQHTLDAELSGMAFEMLRGLIKPEFRGAGLPFAAEVPCPESAPIQDRLLAFTGRQP